MTHVNGTMLRSILKTNACFIRRISVASNAIQTIDNEAYNEVYNLIFYCLNCIRHDQNSTYKTFYIRSITHVNECFVPH